MSGDKIQLTKGQQIVQEQYEGEKQKPMDAAQRAQQLGDQSRRQQASQRSSQKNQAREAEQERNKQAEKRQQPQARARARQEVRTKTEKQMDAFLARNSQLQQSRQSARQATREYQREQQNRSQGPQSWNVYSSRQTPPRARRLILARQAKGRFQPSKNRSLPLTQKSVLPARPSSTLPLKVQYRTTQQTRHSQRPNQPFAGRFRASQNLSRQLNQWIARQQAQAKFLPKQQAAVIHLKGSLVFVKDGNKMRAFKLKGDHTLSELPTDDASDQPLTPQAKAELQKVLRQKAVLSQQSGKGSDLPAELTEAEIAQALAEQEAVENGEGEALDIETQFALLLYEALEEKKKLGKKLGSGEDPQYPSKKDWAAFFAGLAKTGNQEKNLQKSLDQILNLIFRGLYQKSSGKYLVGDLKYSQDGKSREAKFAQLAVESEGFLKFLKQLQPGQSISAEKLSQVFGKELSYLIMAHVGEQALNLSEGAEKNVVFNAKATIDPYSQARLEHSLFGSRKKSSPGLPSENSSSLVPPPSKTNVFANVYELLGLRKLYEGSPKLYTAVAYLLGCTAFGLAAFYLVMKFI